MYFLFLELNSPKSSVIKATIKPQDPINKLPLFNAVPNKPTAGNGVSANDCKEYMVNIEKELAKLLKCKPTMRGMKNKGMKNNNCLLLIVSI